jgi:hypothetical protein
MATEPRIDVLGMPWAELVERVAAVAATGDQRARHRLGAMVEEERRARVAGREPGSAIVRIYASVVLRTTNTRTTEDPDG